MPRVLVLVLAVLAALPAGSPGRTFAQQRPPSTAPVEVMVLGTYHFANPGLDVVKTEVADVLSPAKQAEISAVIEALARFRPTRIAVEAQPSTEARLDSLYQAYRAQRHTLSRNEVQQLGFRLAARLGHPKLYPIDHEGKFPFREMLEYAQAHDPALARAIQDKIAEITVEENRRQGLSISQNLRARNAPEQIAEDHGLYMRFAGVGAGDGFAGAKLLSAWYERNIHIFANLQRIARPGDRILLIFGSGHAAILRELIRSAPGMVLVETNDFLPGS